MKTLKIKIPRKFMNVAVTTDNYLIADTNNSTDWDTLKFPLPKGKWYIRNIENSTVMLISKKKNIIQSILCMFDFHKNYKYNVSEGISIDRCVHCDYYHWR